MRLDVYGWGSLAVSTERRGAESGLVFGGGVLGDMILVVLVVKCCSGRLELGWWLRFEVGWREKVVAYIWE